MSYDFALSLKLAFAQDKVAYVSACPLIFVSMSMSAVLHDNVYMFLIAVIPSTVLSTS